MTLLVPWAMFPKGPACTNAGVPSVVCTRFGRIASLRSAIMPPVASSSFARTGRPSRVIPTMMASRRLRRSSRSFEGENGHNFRGRGDDKAGLPSAAVFFTVERYGYAAQRAVVHIHGAGPRDAFGVQIQIVAVKEMRVNERREQVVRGRDGVKITVEMQIDLRGGLDLRKTAAGRAALHSKHGTERRL